MTGELFVWFLFLVGTVALILVTVVTNKKVRERRGQLLGDALAPTSEQIHVDPDTGTAWCRQKGFDVKFQFATRGSGSSSESWTEVEVTVACQPLLLTMREHHRRDKGLIKDGLAVDVTIGDPGIDERYMIEGAPAAVVKSLFSPAVVRGIHAIAPDEIETTSLGLKLAKKGWNETTGHIAVFVDLAASLAEAARAGVAAAPRAGTSPEVQDLAAMRRRRESHEMFVLLGVVGVLVFIGILAVVFFEDR
jgi:hypothetical protein